METVFFPLLCFSIIIPLWIICGLFSECIANILCSLISLTLLISLILFFFKTDKLKRGTVSLIFIFYCVCTALFTTFFLVQTFSSMFLMSFLLIICPVFFILFLVSILMILAISIFQTRNEISRIIFVTEILLLLSWGVLLITQRHNIQNTLNIFAISFSVLLAAISFSMKYAR